MRGTVNNRKSSNPNLGADCGSFQNLRGPLDTSVPVFARRFAPNSGATHFPTDAARLKTLWKQFSVQLERDLLLLGLSVLTLCALHMSLSREVASDIFIGSQVASLETAAPTTPMFISREGSYLILKALNESMLEKSEETRQAFDPCCNIQTFVIEPKKIPLKTSEKRPSIADWVPDSAKQTLLEGISMLSSKPAPGDMNAHIDSTSNTEAKNRNWSEKNRWETLPFVNDGTLAPTRRRLAKKNSMKTIPRSALTRVYVAEKITNIGDPDTVKNQKPSKIASPRSATLTRSSLGAASIAGKDTQIVHQSIPQMPLGDVSDDTNKITLRNLTASL